MLELHDIPGVHYLETYVPAQAAGDATAYVASVVAPFDCYVESIEYVPVSAITGADNNSRNLNVVAGVVEIANIDFAAGTDASAVTRKAFTITGTTAQRSLDAGTVIALQSERVGTGLDLPAGTLRVGVCGK